MAALSGITAVRPLANTVIEKVIWGATVVVGQLVYKDTTTGKYLLVDTNVSDLTSTISGTVITPGALDEYGLIAKSGSVYLVGTTMVNATVYFGGPTPGEIIPSADVASGHRISRLGTANGTNQLDLAINNTYVLRP